MERRTVNFGMAAMAAGCLAGLGAGCSTGRIEPLPTRSAEPGGFGLVHVARSEDFLRDPVLCRRAAELGQADAQFALALMHQEGRGVPLDPTAAERWLRAAAAGGHPAAQHNLAVRLLETGREPEAIVCLEQAAARNVVESQYLLASLLISDTAGERRDPRRAADLFRRAATAGHPQSQHRLGWMLATGTGVPRDYTEAMTWYRKAADKGLPEAHLDIGILYANGHGVVRDPAAAATWTRSAAERGSAAAAYNLALMHRDGRGTARDPVEACAWMRIAANQGFKQAADALAAMEAGLSPEQRDHARQRSTDARPRPAKTPGP